MNKVNDTTHLIDKLVDAVVELADNINDRVSELEDKVDKLSAPATYKRDTKEFDDFIKSCKQITKAADTTKLGNSLAEVAPKAIEFGMSKEFLVNLHKDEKVIPVKPKNQQRKELIQYAKDKVKEIEDKCRLLEDEITYHINPKKGIVKAIVKVTGVFSGTFTKTAKCSSDDVFNVHIGKAIALSRLFGEVDKRLLNPVQPDEVVEGMKVKFDDASQHYIVVFNSDISIENKHHVYHEYFSDFPEDTFKIIDDSNAKH